MKEKRERRLLEQLHHLRWQSQQRLGALPCVYAMQATLQGRILNHKDTRTNACQSAKAPAGYIEATSSYVKAAALAWLALLAAQGETRSAKPMCR